MARPTRVFVTYTHDSEEHKNQVLALANLLRAHGLDVRLDAWDTHERKDWYVWGQRQITLADYVVVVASARYKKVGDGDVAADENRGAQAEVTALREMFQQDRPHWTRRVLPVLLPGHTADEIPFFLQPRTADHYEIKDITTAGAASLIRVLTQQPVTAATGSASGPERPPTTSRPHGATQVNNASAGGTVFAVQAGDLHFSRRPEVRPDRPDDPDPSCL
ncbi:toll/interleukin-1 receptor domain-containing protein [Kibdelosporangium persicum]|uniref:SEFIR domain-containing protein n=1 Tax=Kibdelosporangium persicum TaxID=2698649 RepID=A0ABX2FIQ2_9PSEU|nr:toll/interleukin-1 receptor domain-containing protein [Kibdelosporangium persicum]NRN70590.1 SEFIR domain-containing protein [Kibdelosporangium persicum]